MNRQYGMVHLPYSSWGQHKHNADGTAVGAGAGTGASAGAGAGTEAGAGAASPPKVTTGGWLDFIGAIVGAGADVVTGVTGVKQAKANAAAVVANAKAQWMTAAIQYKESALNAKLAPIIAAENSKIALAEAKARTQMVVIVGGGALLVALFGLFLFAPAKKRRKRKKR